MAAINEARATIVMCFCILTSLAIPTAPSCSEVASLGGATGAVLSIHGRWSPVVRLPRPGHEANTFSYTKK